MTFMQTLPGSMAGDLSVLNRQRLSSVGGTPGFAPSIISKEFSDWLSGGRVGPDPRGRNTQFVPQTSGNSVTFGAPAPNQPAANFPWRPAELSRPATPYPLNPFTGGAGSDRSQPFNRGGGGGMMLGNASAYNPTMFMGPGGYWPGHQAEFQRQMQSAMTNPWAAAAMSNQPAAAQALNVMAALRDPGRNNRLGNPYGVGRGVGGGGGGGNLAAGYQDAANRAQQETLARYRDALEGYVARQDRNMGRIEQKTNQQLKDNDTAYEALLANRKGFLIGRGLGNSSKIDTAMQGNERERLASRNRILDANADQLTNADMQLSGDVLGVMERRNDVPPDMNQAIQLAQMLGAAGNGAGVGGGGGGVPIGFGMMPGLVGGYRMPAYSLPNASSRNARVAANRAGFLAMNQNKAAQRAVQRGMIPNNGARWMNQMGLDVRGLA